MGLLWDDPTWHWDDVILWDQGPLGYQGGTQVFPFPDSVGFRVPPRRRRNRSLFWN